MKLPSEPRIRKSDQTRTTLLLDVRPRPLIDRVDVRPRFNYHPTPHTRLQIQPSQNSSKSKKTLWPRVLIGHPRLPLLHTLFKFKRDGTQFLPNPRYPSHRRRTISQTRLSGFCQTEPPGSEEGQRGSVHIRQRYLRSSQRSFCPFRI